MKFSDCKTDVARIDYLKAQLTQDDRLIMRCLLAIYNNQTLDEQQSEAVLKHNGIGFRSIDGKILTSYTHQAMKRDVASLLENKNVQFSLSRVFSDKQVDFLKRRMPKYARQLLKVIKEKQVAN